jgi:putative ABC transport system substrate-binding protein
MTVWLTTVRLVVILALVSLITPLDIYAQGPPAGKVYRLGFLRQAPPPKTFIEAFQHGLREHGYVEDQNVVMEYRFDGPLEQLPQFAEELVHRKVDLLLVPNVLAARAAQQATATIPIVLVGVADPVENGLVASLAQPGGNVTGLATLDIELAGKQLELLKEALPTISRMAVLWNPDNPVNVPRMRVVEMAAQAVGVQLHSVEARGPETFASAFAAMTRAHADALLILPDAMSLQHIGQLAALAALHHLPAIYKTREFVEAGGLLCYGASLQDAWQRVATYVDKILQGAKPADLPVELPTKYELVINLKTAKALGITISPELLMLADTVIR